MAIVILGGLIASPRLNLLMLLVLALRFENVCFIRQQISPFSLKRGAAKNAEMRITR